MSSNTPVPVLLGGDLNAYNLARAFHDAYGVKSHVIGRYAVSATKYSKIIIPHIVPGLDDKNVLADTLKAFADEHTGEKLILFGCTDDYVSMIIDAGEAGALNAYAVPYTSARCRDIFAEKADFYEMCEKYGIPRPKTLILKKGDAPDFSEFEFPLVIKPSSSAEYWRHPFDGMRKVYYAKDAADAEKIINSIFASGYERRIIIQEKIKGGDGKMRVLTTYSDRDGGVRLVSLGHVLLEEHTPHGIGNHSAIITEYAPEITRPFVRMLEAERYTGFCNFDIVLDPKTGKYLALDMNLRQGRSNLYVTAAGANIAKIAADDLLFGKPAAPIETKNEVFWHNVPKGVVFEYSGDEALVAKAKALANKGSECSSLFYGYDLKRSPVRLMCVLYMCANQYKKYKENK
ncbi:MAG: ATP-grasp domain-containing protein [Firmicutes bacterium]|nr:ATP-grasp domain-containing protein [Bacillota bacterium]